MRNAADREMPERIGGRTVQPFEGAFATSREGPKAARPQKSAPQHEEKVLPTIEAAIEVCGLSDGMTISFHHSFRDGDRVVNRVLDLCLTKSFQAKLATIASAAGLSVRSGVITAMGKRKVHSQGQAFLDNLSLAQIDKGSVNPEFLSLHPSLGG